MNRREQSAFNAALSVIAMFQRSRIHRSFFSLLVVGGFAIGFVFVGFRSAKARAFAEQKTKRRAERKATKAQKKAKPKFELKDGDRVVFLGNTLIERAQKYGYWETMLTARYPNRKIIFRNLGWDGDTVWAESRGIFDTPEKGYERMLAHVGRIKPTVIFLGYGNNEAFAGKKGLPRFVKQYNKLLDDLTRVSAKGARFVLVLPVFQEEDSHPSPAGARTFNRTLFEYSLSLMAIAKEWNAYVVDFTPNSHPMRQAVKRLRSGGAEQGNVGQAKPLTTNGIHLSAYGYRVCAERFVFRQGWTFGFGTIGNPFLGLDGSKARVIARAGFDKVTDATSKPHLKLKTRRTRLYPFKAHLFFSLPDGRYSLKVDGNVIATRTAKLWKGRVNDPPITLTSERAQFEKLRQTIIAKNRLYFHSWRPQNITYLFLFRKHEQGQNAKEVEQFRKLVAAKEKEIDRLKKPVTRTYELIRVKPKQKK